MTCAEAALEANLPASRHALVNDEIREFEIWYSHNLPRPRM